MDKKLVAKELLKVAKLLTASLGEEEKLYSERDGEFYLFYSMKIHHVARLDDVVKRAKGLYSNIHSDVKKLGSSFKGEEAVYIGEDGEVSLGSYVIVKNMNPNDLRKEIEKLGYKRD